MTADVDRDERDRLIRLETKVDLVLVQLDRHTADIEKRVRLLEGFRWKLHGICAAVAVIAGAVGDLIMQMITH